MPTPADLYPFAGQQIPCYVNGEPVRAGGSFENVNPVNGRVIATVTEADAALVDRAVARRARCALRSLGAHAGRRALRAAAQGGRAHRAALPRVRRRRDRRHRQDAQAGDLARHPARRGQFPRLRGPPAGARLGVLRDVDARRPRRAQLLGAQAGRRGGGDRALEPAVPAHDLEGGSRARLRQHGGRQALGGDAVLRDAARSGDAGGRRSARSIQPGAWLRSCLHGRGAGESPGGERHRLYR